MFIALLSLLSLAADAADANCPEVRFAFQGQPDCVQLEFTGDRTALVNQCEAPLIVDQSVSRFAPSEAPVRFVAAGASAEIRDLNAFSVGLQGQIYQVVAVLADSGTCEVDSAPEALASHRVDAVGITAAR